MSAPVSAWRAAVLLAGLRLRRRLNQLGASLARVRVPDDKRKATARNSPVRWLVGGFAAVWLLAGSAIFAHEALLNMERVLGSTLVRTLPEPAARSSDIARLPDLVRVPLPPLPGEVLAAGVIQGATLALSLLMVVALLLALAGREIASPEWDLEWLATLPLPLPTLLASRIIERVATNTSGFVALVPFLSMLAWFCGYGWSAPALGMAYALVLLFVVATVQTLVDTGLRLSLPPHRLRNLHALISIAGVLVLFAVVSMGLPDRTFILDLAALLPSWLMWTPPGLVVRTLVSTETGNAVIWSSALVAETILIVLTGVWAVGRQLRHWVVSAGARETVARGPTSERPVIRWSRARSLLSPVQWRELLLLARDRTFGVQTLAMPLLIVGMQILLNAGSDIFAGAIDAPGTLALIAFGLASYTLMFSEFRALNVEGQALWILYCVPRSIESVLREKVVLWSALAGFFPLVMFVIAMIAAGGPSPAFLGAAAVVVIGVPIFAVIATALGVFGCDPLANDVRARVRGSYLYLYMLLASLYSFAIFMQDFWQRAALITLTALLAVALWQNARAQLPYLLDPSASPPASVSVADGLIATLLFFVLQALIATAALLLVRSRVATPGIVLIAYCGAGAATYGVMRFVYWRVRTAGVPQIWGAGVPVALGWGAAGGVAAAAAAIAYVELAQRFGFLSADESFSGGLREILWLAAIAVLAAPVFEEFIFRGLIFGSLRRSLDFFPAAFASAAVFALVHPPAAVIPLVVLGLCAALAYERTGMLAAPIVAHGIYNASVLVWGLR